MNTSTLNINNFNKISLKDLNEVKLQNRIDTKFVFKYSKLNALLSTLESDYDMLLINNEADVFYKSQYFDTNNLDSFYDHHKGKNERFKIRIRNYVSSKLNFFEIKKKIKGRTVKSRIPVDNFSKEVTEKSADFISSKLNINTEKLTPSIQINYKRITLASKKRDERLTLDIQLTYINGEKKVILDDLVIAELKQSKLNRTSKFYIEAKKLQIRNLRISKYCTGIILTHNNIKYNNFKEKLLYINKLTNGDIIGNIAA